MHGAAKKRANISGVGKINNYCEDIYTVEPPNKGHFGVSAFVPCREVVPISEVLLFLL